MDNKFSRREFLKATANMRLAQSFGECYAIKGAKPSCKCGCNRFQVFYWDSHRKKYCLSYANSWTWCLEKKKEKIRGDPEILLEKGLEDKNLDEIEKETWKCYCKWLQTCGKIFS